MTDRRQGFTPLFVGADELVAVLDRSHPRHVDLADLWRLFLEPDTVLVTTDCSVVKASLAVQAGHGRAGLEALHLRCLPAMRVERCRAGDLERAVAVLLSLCPEGAGEAAPDLVACAENEVRRRLAVERLSGP